MVRAHSTLRRESTVKRENQGDKEEFRPEEKKKMTKESIRIFRITQKLGKNFIYRHHIEPRSTTYVPREESSLFHKFF